MQTRKHTKEDIQEILHGPAEKRVFWLEQAKTEDEKRRAAIDVELDQPECFKRISFKVQELWPGDPGYSLDIGHHARPGTGSRAASFGRIAIHKVASGDIGGARNSATCAAWYARKDLSSQGL